MFTRKQIAIASGAVLLIATLALSHWFAYAQGVATQEARLAAFAEKALATHALDNATALQGGVHVLRRAAKDPQAFPPEEVREWREKVARWRLNVEQIAIPYLRKRGLEEAADAYAGLVREALALEAKLQV